MELGLVPDVHHLLCLSSNFPSTGHGIGVDSSITEAHNSSEKELSPSSAPAELRDCIYAIPSRISTRETGRTDSREHQEQDSHLGSGHNWLDVESVRKEVITD